MDDLLSKANSIRGILHDLLLDDRTMSLMSFSKITKNPKLYSISQDKNDEELWINEHVEVEMLIESYLQLIESTIISINNAKKRIVKNAETDLLLKLDIARNKLLKVEIGIQAITSACAVGAMVAGIFGMNLPSGISTTPPCPYLYLLVVFPL